MFKPGSSMAAKLLRCGFFHRLYPFCLGVTQPTHKSTQAQQLEVGHMAVQATMLRLATITSVVIQASAVWLASSVPLQCVRVNCAFTVVGFLSPLPFLP